MVSNTNRYKLLEYLASKAKRQEHQVPSLAHISAILNVSVASLREQLEVARMLGIVEIKPRKGIRLLPYSIRPAVCQSVSFAVTINPPAFFAFSDLRNHVEASYWHKAVTKLIQEDHQFLNNLIIEAKDKLSTQPIQIPHQEHRELHLTIFSRLENPFVLGILEAYWEIYEAIGFNLYADFQYLKNVWDYHQRIVEAIISKNYDAGYQLLVEHAALLQTRADNYSGHLFE